MLATVLARGGVR